MLFYNLQISIKQTLINNSRSTSLCDLDIVTPRGSIQLYLISIFGFYYIIYDADLFGTFKKRCLL